MVSLAAALLLYDNYLLAVSLFAEDGKLRRLLNRGDRGYGLDQSVLDRITLSYHSAGHRRRVREAIRFYDAAAGGLDEATEADPATRYLHLLIRQSPSYGMTRSRSPLASLGRSLGFLGDVTGDSLRRLASEGMNLFSMLFGNAVGLIEARHGKLYRHAGTLRLLDARLRAGDILLEKTPFRLTDTFIPGHWGHAALWIGSEDELRALGLWDHELVVPHRDAIRAGRGIVEALRNGVQTSSLESFSNVDDLAVLRDAAAADAQRAEIVLLALRQLGKAYDFNFDVETTDRIVCSELVYLAYTGIDWPTDNRLGRATSSPDNIARKAVDGGPLEVVVLFHDGGEVGEEPARALRALLGE